MGRFYRRRSRFASAALAAPPPPAPHPEMGEGPVPAEAVGGFGAGWSDVARGAYLDGPGVYAWILRESPTGGRYVAFPTFMGWRALPATVTP